MYFRFCGFIHMMEPTGQNPRRCMFCRVCQMAASVRHQTTLCYPGGSTRGKAAVYDYRLAESVHSLKTQMMPFLCSGNLIINTVMINYGTFCTNITTLLHFRAFVSISQMKSVGLQHHVSQANQRRFVARTKR